MSHVNQSLFSITTISVARNFQPIAYCLKLSTSGQNPAYGAVFAGKFKSFFDYKPNQIPSLGIRVQPDTGDWLQTEELSSVFHSCNFSLPPRSSLC